MNFPIFLRLVTSCLMLISLGACTDGMKSVFKETLLSDAAKSKDDDPSTAPPQSNLCEPGSLETRSCVQDKPGAEQATQSYVCVPEGDGYEKHDGCVVDECQDGYLKDGNDCVQQACQPGSQKTVSCTEQIAGSKIATQEMTCLSNGLGYTATQPCAVTECQAGHHRTSNTTCQPHSCVPNSKQVVNCTNEISNSTTATKEITCNANGLGTAVTRTCRVDECASGYQKNGNSCRKNNCTPGSQSTESCVAEIANSATATQEMICANDGQSYNPSGTCQLLECQSGYQVNGSSCRKNICEPNSKKTESCTAEVLNAKTATKELTCDSTGQTQTETKNCEISECNPGFSLHGNTCKPDCVTSNKSFKFGETETRVRFQSSTVVKPATCNQQNQTRTCGENATFSDWSGSFQFEGCTPVEPAQVEVSVDMKYYNPMVSESDRWKLKVSGELTEVLKIGTDILEEKEPLKLPIKISNPGEQAISVSATSNPIGFIIHDFPTSVPAGQEVTFYISGDVNRLGTHKQRFTFRANNKTYILNLEVNIK